jgi:hypothetical protein
MDHATSVGRDASQLYRIVAETSDDWDSWDVSDVTPQAANWQKGLDWKEVAGTPFHETVGIDDYHNIRDPIKFPMHSILDSNIDPGIYRRIAKYRMSGQRRASS